MEPERRIEKWLRAFAKKRREQAGDPMELRPATRQLLQREIARQAEDKNRGGSFFDFLLGPRLRLVFAVCFIVVVLGTLAFWPSLAHHKPTDLSLNKASYPGTPGTAAPVAPTPETPPPAVMSPPVASTDKKVSEERQKAVPAAPQPAPTVVASANRALTQPPKEETRDRGENGATQKQLIVTTASASVPTNSTLFAYKNETAMDSLSRTGATTKDAEGAFPAVATPPAGSSLIAGTLTPNTNALAFQKALAAPGSTNAALFDLAKATGVVTVSQAFNRLATPSTRRRAGASAGAVATPAPVLTSFRVEQNGNNLKVVDADGSIYTGSVQIAQQEPASEYSFAAAKNTKNTPIGAATRSLKTDVPKPQGYFFRVAGTNRNLNETVVFSGNFVPFTNNQLTAGAHGFGGVAGGFGGGGGAEHDQPAGQPIQAVLANSQINGNVVIGDQKPVNVVATPAQ